MTRTSIRRESLGNFQGAESQIAYYKQIKRVSALRTWACVYFDAMLHCFGDYGIAGAARAKRTRSLPPYTGPQFFLTPCIAPFLYVLPTCTIHHPARNAAIVPTNFPAAIRKMLKTLKKTEVLCQDGEGRIGPKSFILWTLRDSVGTISVFHGVPWVGQNWHKVFPLAHFWRRCSFQAPCSSGGGAPLLPLLGFLPGRRTFYIAQWSFESSHPFPSPDFGPREGGLTQTLDLAHDPKYKRKSSLGSPCIFFKIPSAFGAAFSFSRRLRRHIDFSSLPPLATLPQVA
eukprot:gene21943-biopygen5705